MKRVVGTSGTRLLLVFAAALLSCLPSLGFPADAPNTTNVAVQPAPTQSASVTNRLPAFQVETGFRVELVASEPSVVAPVAMAFDENGRLFVAEMRDYPDKRNQVPHLGRIRVLEEMDEEGVFRQSTIYAENLAWPSALACYDGGVFVAATPEIIYLKDSRGNGNADIRKVVFTGFGDTNRLDARYLLSGFSWGLDNRIHGVTAGIGGLVRSPGSPEAEPVDLFGSDFSFDPRTLSIAPETGGGQSGLTFDARGRKLVCGLEYPLRQPMFELRYFYRNPFAVKPPGVTEVAPPAMEVFSHPRSEEGAERGPRAAGSGEAGRRRIDTNSTVAVWFTNAHGCVSYRGGLFATNYFQNVFIPDAEAGIVHRAIIRENGLQMWTERPPEGRGREFLMSTDPTFRPVQVVIGPEGALYIADLNSGGDRGRIYRVVPENFKQSGTQKPGAASTTELVNLLAAPNGWQRDTAARLLYQRQDTNAVQPLANMANNSRFWTARMQALHMLEGLGALREGHVLKGLGDSDERVREHALSLLASPNAGIPLTFAISNRLYSLAADPSLRVRYQLAFTVGGLRGPAKVPILGAVLGRDLDNPWLRAAVMSSLNDGGGEMLFQAAGDPRFVNGVAGPVFLRQLADMVGVQGRLDEVTRALSFFEAVSRETPVGFGLLADLGEGLQRTRSSLELADRQGRLQGAFARALTVSTDGTIPVPARVQAIRLLGVSTYTYTQIGEWLMLLLDPSEAPAVRAAAVGAVRRYSDPMILADLVTRWRSFPPVVRNEAVAMMVSRADRAAALLAAIGDGRVAVADLSQAQVNFLRTHPNTIVGRRATELFGPPPRRRPGALDALQPALKLTGAPARGREIFQARCAACHRLGGLGQKVGPDLAGAKVWGRERLLAQIVEPNARITPGFETTVGETGTGEDFFGIRTDQSAFAITLRQLDGSDLVLPAANVQFVEAQAWSLMPEGVETGLTPQAMADLLAFIMTGPR
jgi:putative membrane-bound dehydrogenase-like protein